jgi:cell wall-associated NlpC family hydrolase
MKSFYTLATITLITLCSCTITFAVESGYAKVYSPAPVFSNPAIAGAAIPPKPDHCGQTRSLEFIAMPGTPVSIIKKLQAGSIAVYQITTPVYRPPAGTSLFVAAEYLTLTKSPAPQPVNQPPSPDQITARLRQLEGQPYSWGSNLSTGIRWHDGSRLFRGIDCSGLLYEATGGFTPRNSADLVNFGKGIEIEGLSAQQILGRLKPLDLLVWKGHVVIVLDGVSTIESVLSCNRTGQGGVRITPLQSRLAQLMQTRTPANRWPDNAGRKQLFVVRRWVTPD